MFSLIIPTYNEEKFLAPLLQSIKKQTLLPAEIIVSDNNSSDKTRKIANLNGCKIVKGGVPGIGRNKGAMAAKEDILVFLDADVKIESSKFFENLILHFKKSKTDIASCYFSYSPEDSFSLQVMSVATFFSKNINKVLAKKVKKLIGELTGCFIVKKDFFLKIGGFDKKLSVMEDTDFFQRAVEEDGKYTVLPIGIKVSDRRYAKQDIIQLSKVGFYLFVLLISGFFGYRYPEKILKLYETERSYKK